MKNIVWSLALFALATSCLNSCRTRTKTIDDVDTLESGAKTQLTTPGTTLPDPLKNTDSLKKETQTALEGSKTTQHPSQEETSPPLPNLAINALVHLRSDKAKPKNPSILLGHGDSFSLGSGLLLANPTRLLVPTDLAGSRKTIQVVEQNGQQSLFESADSAHNSSFSLFVGTTTNQSLPDLVELLSETTIEAGEAVTVYSKPTNQNEMAIVHSSIVFADVKNPLKPDETRFAIDTTLCDVISGGIVADSKNKVLGLVGKDFQNLCLVIPLDTASVPQWVAKKEEPTGAGPWIGLELSVLKTSPESTPKDYVFEYGAAVKDVSPDGPAQASGLQKGDILLSVNQNKVTTDSLKQDFDSMQIGSPLELTIWRKGQTLNIQLVPTAAP